MINKLLYILSAVILLMSCEKDIDLDINDQTDKLVMYAFIYQDSALDLSISKSQSILAVENYALVDKGRFELQINDQAQGKYILPSDTIWSSWSEFSFEEKDQIKIKAFELEGDTVESTTFIPHRIPIVQLDTNTVVKNVTDVGNVDMLRSVIKFQEPVNEVNYYQLHIVREGWGKIGEKDYYTRKVIDFEDDDDVFTHGEQSGSLLPGIDFQGLFTDELINGKLYELEVNIPRDNLLFAFEKEDKIKITYYLYHHTYDYYSYLRSIILAGGYEGFYRRLPIFEPVKIHSNVEGGLGLVSGMSFDSDSLVFNK